MVEHGSMRAVVLLLYFYAGTIGNTHPISEDAAFVEEHNILQDHPATRSIHKRFQKAGYSSLGVASVFHLDSSGTAYRFNSKTLLHERRKRGLSADDGSNISLNVTAMSETFTLKLKHTSGVLNSDAHIVIRTGTEKTYWKGEIPRCFLVGEATSHNSGSVSLSYCEGLRGIIETDQFVYALEPAPVGLKRRLRRSSDDDSVLVYRAPMTTLPEDDAIIIENIQRERLRRQASSFPANKTLVIETAVFSDMLQTLYMEERGADTVVKKIAFMVLKWNGVQGEWAKSDMIGYQITIKLTHMEFWQNDPPGYVTDFFLGTALGSFCIWQSYSSNLSQAVDLSFLHTGISSADVAGRAYYAQTCVPIYRCGVTADPKVTHSRLTTHEIGHSMGLNHDEDVGCENEAGIMGAGFGWSSCTEWQIDDFMGTGTGDCLYEENVPFNEIDVELQGLDLTPVLAGITETLDDICAQLVSIGWGFRPFPFWGTCEVFSCINMNDGLRFGQMAYQLDYISGRYCGDSQICIGPNCVMYNDTGEVFPFNVILGGWSNWGPFSTCSRTCGTGMTLARRTCTNPTPQFAAPCTGLDYKGQTCNEQPCPGDHNIESELINQRIVESCQRLIDGGALDSTKYVPSGTIFSPLSFGVCEVLCDIIGPTPRSVNERNGLMPDGTPCPADLPAKDLQDWPRRPGYSSRCVKGYCRVLGCDGSLDDKTFDGCGVCDGDSTSCIIVQGTYTTPVVTGDRITLFNIPTGAYNLEFQTTSAQNDLLYVELWTKDDRAVIASRIAYSWVYDTGVHPIYFAGTYWTFSAYRQHLYAKGPIDQPVVIKLHRQSDGITPDVHYAYSTPQDVGTCTGSCNDGIFWNCGCQCIGKFGIGCSSDCNNLCNNGFVVNEATCACACGIRTYGLVCSCKYPFKGEACSECKIWKCENGGVLNEDTCRCSCPAGTGGLACEKPCANVTDDCSVRLENGECISNNEHMEANCELACGLCETGPLPTPMMSSSTDSTSSITASITTDVTSLTSPAFTTTGGLPLTTKTTIIPRCTSGSFCQNGSQSTTTNSTSIFVMMIHVVIYVCVNKI